MDNYRDVLVLHSGAKWFQSIVIPLVEGSLHFILAELVSRVGECLKLVVANFVEPHILLELLKGALATDSLEH